MGGGGVHLLSECWMKPRSKDKQQQQLCVQAARGSDNLFMRMCGVSRSDQLSFSHMLPWQCSGQRTRMEGRKKKKKQKT